MDGFLRKWVNDRELDNTNIRIGQEVIFTPRMNSRYSGSASRMPGDRQTTPSTRMGLFD
jgi:hypothetical protein